MSDTMDLDDMSSADSQILQMNGLRYKMPQSLSTTNKRSFIREFSQSSSYTPSQTIVFDINSGAQYIEAENAMLSFSLTVVANTAPNVGDTYSWGSGSAANLFHTIRIISKNGVELDRVEHSNVLSSLLQRWVYTEESQGLLETAGVDQTYVSGVGGITTQYNIPLNLLTRFFKPQEKHMKVPAGLMSGLRIEFELETAARALTRTAGTGTNFTYTMNNPTIHFLSHNLNDATSAALMKESAKSGLEYTFQSTFTTPIQGQTSLSINEQVKKAVSQATRVYAGIYDNANAQDETADSFATRSGADLVDYQYRIGSDFFPQSIVSNTVDAYYITSSTFDNNRDIKTRPSSVTYGEYTTNRLVVGVPVETNSNLNLTGVALNNSNSLELRLNLVGAATRDIFVFTDYTAVARVFVNSTNLKI